jgi:hypothetical protein
LVDFLNYFQAFNFYLRQKYLLVAVKTKFLYEELPCFVKNLVRARLFVPQSGHAWAEIFER